MFVLTAVSFECACQVVRIIVVKEPNSNSSKYLCTYHCSLWKYLPSGPNNKYSNRLVVMDPNSDKKTDIVLFLQL